MTDVARQSFAIASFEVEHSFFKAGAAKGTEAGDSAIAADDPTARLAAVLYLRKTNKGQVKVPPAGYSNVENRASSKLGFGFGFFFVLHLQKLKVKPINSGKDNIGFFSANPLG